MLLATRSNLVMLLVMLRSDSVVDAVSGTPMFGCAVGNATSGGGIDLRYSEGVSFIQPSGAIRGIGPSAGSLAASSINPRLDRALRPFPAEAVAAAPVNGDRPGAAPAGEAQRIR